MFIQFNFFIQPSHTMSCPVNRYKGSQFTKPDKPITETAKEINDQLQSRIVERERQDAKLFPHNVPPAIHPGAKDITSKK
jgi:hypothetical protein